MMKAWGKFSTLLLELVLVSLPSSIGFEPLCTNIRVKSFLNWSIPFLHTNEWMVEVLSKSHLNASYHWENAYHLIMRSLNFEEICLFLGLKYLSFWKLELQATQFIHYADLISFKRKPSSLKHKIWIQKATVWSVNDGLSGGFRNPLETGRRGFRKVSGK